jgi:hypothetical protein
VEDEMTDLAEFDSVDLTMIVNIAAKMRFAALLLIHT